MKNLIRFILMSFLIIISSTTINSNLVSSMLCLDDGTKVVLSTGSILVYPDDPSAYSFRYARLSGNGVFIVAPSDAWFILHLDNMLVKTKEATFAITTKQVNGKEVQDIHVKSGKVEIDHDHPHYPDLRNT